MSEKPNLWYDGVKWICDPYRMNYGNLCPKDFEAPGGIGKTPQEAYEDLKGKSGAQS